MLDDMQNLLEIDYDDEFDDDEFDDDDEFEASYDDEFDDDEFDDDDEFEASYDDEFDYDDEFEYDSPFDEATEIELASELLTIGSDEELEYFFGKLIRRAARGIKRFSRSRLGRRLVGRLKGLARRALPRLGRALGRRIAGRTGARWGGRLARMGGRYLGLELEGMSPEDQEFEIARHMVRLAGTAAAKAAAASPSAPADMVVNKALQVAARKHAPGLTKPGGHGLPSGGRRSGRWIRRGRRIIVFGA